MRIRGREEINTHHNKNGNTPDKANYGSRIFFQGIHGVYGDDRKHRKEKHERIHSDTIPDNPVGGYNKDECIDRKN